jgi:hypothetical protein
LKSMCTTLMHIFRSRVGDVPGEFRFWILVLSVDTASTGFNLSINVAIGFHLWICSGG